MVIYATMTSEARATDQRVDTVNPSGPAMPISRLGIFDGYNKDGTQGIHRSCSRTRGPRNSVDKNCPDEKRWATADFSSLADDIFF